VGQSFEAYQLWLGADPHQTRLAQVYMEKMSIHDLEVTLEPLLVMFKQQRQRHESFGDFCHRIGFDQLRQFSAQYSSRIATANGRIRRRIGVRDEVYTELKAIATTQGIPMSELATRAIEAYVERMKGEG